MKQDRIQPRSGGLTLGGRAGGYSLVEMMVAVTIGLAIIAALTSLLVSTNSSNTTNQRTSEILSNGRYAMSALKADLRGAGFRGYSWAEPNIMTTTLGTITGECLQSGGSAGGFVTNVRQGIWGVNDSNPFSANCIPSASFATGGGDVMVLRKLSGNPATALTTNGLYFRSSYAQGELFRANQTSTCPATTPVTPSPFDKVPCMAGIHGVDLQDYALQVYVYYVSPFTTSATESPLVPALWRVALQADGSMSRELVVSGVEHFQVQYGRATTDGNTRYYDANNIAGTSYVTTISEWDDVNSVRIWLLIRNSTAEPNYSNTNTYVMGDQTYTVNDSFRRQLFSTVVQLRN